MSTFLGILNDGTRIDSQSLEHITATPHIKYLFKVEIGNTVRFIPVGKDGNPQVITVGDFELVLIGEDKLSNRGPYERDVTVQDKRTGKNYKAHFKPNGLDFIKHDLLPFLDKLQEVGSFEMYEIFLELDEQKKENLRLQEKIDSLKHELELSKKTQLVKE